MATGDLCSLSDVKASMTNEGTADDVYLARLITAQSKYLERVTGRVFSDSTWTDIFGGNDDRIRQRGSVNLWSPTIQILGQRGYAVSLRKTPVKTVTQVMVDGIVIPARPALVANDANNALATDGYVLVDASRVELQGSYGFTPGISNIQVDYTTGWPAEDLAVIADAVINAVIWRFKMRDRVGHLTTTTAAGGLTISYSREAIDPYTQMIIDLYSTVRV